MPAHLTYAGRLYPIPEGDQAPLTVLDILLRAGVNVPFSCRKGICHTCMMRCTHGHIPPTSQHGVGDTWAEQGHFLPCHCVPTGDMTLEPADPSTRFVRAVVQSKRALSPDVFAFDLEPYNAMTWRAGQFINVRRPSDGLTRSYSLASLPDEDYYLTLHVKRDPDGEMSRWLCDALTEGAEVEVQGPNGSCFFEVDHADQPLLLLATGTGLGPLWGLARDALRSGHRGNISLYHGVRRAEGLYGHDALTALAKRHPNFQYIGCVSGEGEVLGEGVRRGRVHDVAKEGHEELGGVRVYMCGRPAMVFEGRVWTTLRGVRRERTFADAFVGAHVEVPPDDMAIARSIPPDLELWEALRGGPGLMEILKDFYPRVYADAQLSPFFVHVTMQRVIEKQYEFTREALTGSLDYFGMRPFNAHHWMVISDALFDHREALLEGCMRRYGLAEHLIRRWCALDEMYRHSMVKAQPRGLWMGGEERPAEGFGRVVLEVGSLCDGCGRELPEGVEVRYHLRTGAIYCGQCDAGA